MSMKYKFLYPLVTILGITNSYSDLVSLDPLSPGDIDALKMVAPQPYWRIAGYKLKESDEYGGYALIARKPTFELNRVCVVESSSALLLKEKTKEKNWEISSDTDHWHIYFLPKETAQFNCLSLRFEKQYVEVHSDNPINIDDKQKLIGAYDFFIGLLTGNAVGGYENMDGAKYIGKFSSSDISDIGLVNNGKDIFVFTLSNPSKTEYVLDISIQCFGDKFKVMDIQSGVM